jgi:hypothetical protein
LLARIRLRSSATLGLHRRFNHLEFVFEAIPKGRCGLATSGFRHGFDHDFEVVEMPVMS